MKTFASLFSGFGGADIGAMQAGLTPIWGVEYDPDIAGVAKTNGLDFMVADVREVDYATLETPWWLNASFVCKNFSSANANGEETYQDIQTALAGCKAIRTLQPPFVSVENVRKYERSESFRLIVRCLMDEGYNVAWWVLNSADYGVPQTRERLCLIASRTERVHKPIQTHAKEPPHDAQLSMFDTPTVKRWVGWYETIEDLLPGLEDTKLAEWQWKFMPDEIKTMLIPGANGSTARAYNESEPSITVTAAIWKGAPRAVVFPANRQNWANNQPQGGDDPIYTIKASIGAKTALPKAVLIDGANSKRNGESARYADEPALTATTPISHKTVLCADVPYRIVKLNSRCLARFQSFPDWYKLPDSNKLACTGVGNAKPATLQQAEIEAQLISQRAVA